MLAGDFDALNALATSASAIFACLAVVAAVAGIFKEQIHQFFFPVRVHVEWNAEEPFLGVYKANSDDPVWESPSFHHHKFELHLRLLVTNLGNTDARNVQVFIQSCEQKLEADWVKVPNFVPIRLLWSHVNTPVIPLMTSGTQHFCNFGIWWRRKDDELGATIVPDQSGRHFVMAAEVEHKGAFFGPTNVMRRAADDPLCCAEYRFQMLIACEGGVTYKACWLLKICEYDEQITRIPLMELKEHKIIQTSQSRLPW
jgi:hypothetical protein